MSVQLEVALIGVVAISILINVQLPCVPIAVAGRSLGSPVGPNAEFRIAKPIGTLELLEGFRGSLEWAGHQRQVLHLGDRDGVGLGRIFDLSTNRRTRTN